MYIGGGNVLGPASQRASMMAAAGRSGAPTLRRKCCMARGRPVGEIESCYRGAEGESLEKVVILSGECKAAANVIYTFGLHALSKNEDGVVRLFHEFVSGFRAN